MPNTGQHSPNITGKAARCFKNKLEFLSRIEGIRAISIERPIKKSPGNKPAKTKRKVWKEEGRTQNNVQRIVWHNVWMKQTFILIF